MGSPGESASRGGQPSLTVSPVDDDGYVVVDWRSDGPDEGLLTCSAASRGFAGRGKAWFDPSTIAAFAAACHAYPLPTGGPLPELTGGYGGSLDGSSEPVETVRLRLYPVGTKGQLGMAIELRSDWPWERAEERCSVGLELLCSYEGVVRFSESLNLAVAQGRGQARLPIDRLD